MIRSLRAKSTCSRILKLCLVLALIALLFLHCFTTLTPASKTPRPQIPPLAPRVSIVPELHARISQALQIADSEIARSAKGSSALPRAVSTEVQAVLRHLHCVHPSDSTLELGAPSPVDHNTTGALCDRIHTSLLAAAWDISELCSRLISKQILIVGSRRTYKLHDTLLSILPPGSQGSQPKCHGAALCTWHEICSHFPASAAISPLSSERHITPPHELSNSAILRFALSSTLRTSAFDDPVVRPYLNPLTGVREYDAPDWLEKARRSDIVILTKGPVPAPSWSYKSSNWSNIDARFTMRIPKPASREWEGMQPFIHLLPWPQGVLRGYGPMEAAWTATMMKWLPELVETLVNLRTDRLMANRGRLFLWLGAGFSEEGCTCQPRERLYDDQTDQWLSRLFQCLGHDDRCVFDNFQVYIHNMLLNQLLANAGLLYLPEASPSSSKSILGSLSHRRLPRDVTWLAGHRSVDDNVTTGAGNEGATHTFLYGLIVSLRWYQGFV